MCARVRVDLYIHREGETHLDLILSRDDSLAHDEKHIVGFSKVRQVKTGAAPSFVHVVTGRPTAAAAA